MSEEEQLHSQPEVKDEDANAPINVKASILLLLLVFHVDIFLLCFGPGSFSPLVVDSVQVVSSTGDEVFFKIKRSTKLSKLQGAYAAKVGKDVGSIRCVIFGFFLCFKTDKTRWAGSYMTAHGYQRRIHLHRWIWKITVSVFVFVF